MRELGLHTVCEEARCPNIGECWEHKAATFMILGDVCTRNCTYCAVAHGTPKAFDPLEPVRLAEAVERMGLAHVVITSVDRDDLPNGGAEAFAGCITEIRRRLPDTTVEVLIPDFKGSERALAIVMDARPGHPESQPRDRGAAVPPGPARGAATTARCELLARARRMAPDGLTKSGIIVGMGEEWDELLVCMRDLRRSDVNILTLGQYLRPSDGHLPVVRYYTPDEFAELRDIGSPWASPTCRPARSPGPPTTRGNRPGGPEGRDDGDLAPGPGRAAGWIRPAPTSTATGSARCCSSAASRRRRARRTAWARSAASATSTSARRRSRWAASPRSGPTTTSPAPTASTGTRWRGA